MRLAVLLLLFSLALAADPEFFFDETCHSVTKHGDGTFTANCAGMLTVNNTGNVSIYSFNVTNASIAVNFNDTVFTNVIKPGEVKKYFYTVNLSASSLPLGISSVGLHAIAIAPLLENATALTLLKINIQKQKFGVSNYNVTVTMENPTNMETNIIGIDLRRGELAPANIDPSSLAALDMAATLPANVSAAQSLNWTYADTWVGTPVYTVGVDHEIVPDETKTLNVLQYSDETVIIIIDEPGPTPTPIPTPSPGGVSGGIAVSRPELTLVIPNKVGLGDDFYIIAIFEPSVIYLNLNFTANSTTGLNFDSRFMPRVDGIVYVYLNSTVPEDADLGVHYIQFTLLRNGRKMKQYTVPINVVKEAIRPVPVIAEILKKDLKIEMPVKAEANTTQGFDLKISMENNGTLVLDDVRITVDVPDGWHAREKRVGQMYIKQKEDVLVRVVPGEHLEKVSETVTVHVSDGEEEIFVIDVDVEVGVPRFLVSVWVNSSERKNAVAFIVMNNTDRATWENLEVEFEAYNPEGIMILGDFVAGVSVPAGQNQILHKVYTLPSVELTQERLPVIGVVYEKGAVNTHSKATVELIGFDPVQRPVIPWSIFIIMLLVLALVIEFIIRKRRQ